jgi:multidrug efflux system membrane fusion protein
MNPPNSLWRPAALVLPVVSAWFLTGCNSQPPAGATGFPPPPTVTVAAVETREIIEHEEVVGRTEAVDSVEIRPRVSGYIQEVRFKSGQKVKKGDLLFLIDPRTRQAALDRAEADLRRAQSSLENAQAEAARAERLLTTKAISKEESDTRAWKLTDAQAVLLAAQAARESARLELEFCEVRSPIDGRVSRALVTPGNNVSGVDGNTTLLTTVVSIDPIYVLSDVDETTALRFKRLALEQKLERDEQGRIAVEMALADEQEFPRKGFVESVDNRLNPGTGSILVRSAFPNPDELIIPGLFVRARIPVGQPKPTLLISDRAIGTDQSQKFVLTLTSSNTVAYRPVKIGPVVDGKRVIREGLVAGEKVVVNGLAKVRPGMPVTPEAEPAPQAATR